jgi:hypothetical protein
VSLPVTHPATVVDSSEGEAGTGLIGTSAAVGAFLLFLLFAVQVTLTLHATSVVTAAGYDAARIVAARQVDHHDEVALAAAERRAAGRFATLLGRAAAGADLHWIVGAESVELHVTVAAPHVLPSIVGGPTGIDQIDRTFVVRIEERR